MDSKTLKVSEVATILKIDSATVRYLINSGRVGWGIAFKLPKSKRTKYLIYRDRFVSDTGIELNEKN